MPVFVATDRVNTSKNKDKSMSNEHMIATVHKYVEAFEAK